MADVAHRYEAVNYLDTSFQRKGIGGWRQLYLQFIEQLAPLTVIEFGAGAPDFLDRIDAERRIAVDIGRQFADEFRSRRIEFAQRDLERDRLSDLGPVNVAICSDVFEHLVDPAVALFHIAGVLDSRGILFSHVPNEYRLRPMLAIMAGRSETVMFHRGHTEWEDPHFRRFSDRGYRAFLAQRFRYNLCLTDLRYGFAARVLKRLGIPVPYALQGGPTYASTNDETIFRRLVELKKAMAHG